MTDTELFAGFVWASLLATGGGLMVLVTRNHGDTLRFQRKLFLVSFAIRFAMSALLYVAGLNSKIVGSGDDSGWYRGVTIRDSWEADGVGPLSWPVALLEAYEGHHQGYGYLLAVYFSITRIPSQLSAAAVDCLFGALMAVLAYRSARLLFSEWVAVRVGWWTCCFPLMIIWSCQSIKEPVIILLEGLALYGCLCVKVRGFTIRHVLLMVVSIAVLPSFRFYAAYVSGGVVFLTLAMPQIRRKRFSPVSAVIVGVLVLFVLTGTGVLDRNSKSFEDWEDVDRITQFRKDIAAGTGSGVASSYDMHSRSGLGLATLDGALHLLLAPFPWELNLGSLRMLLTLPEMVVWWCLMVQGVVPGLRYAIRHRLGDVFPLLLFLGGLGLIYSLTFGNVGVIYRQRAQLMPYLLMFAASGLELRKLRRRGWVVREGSASPILALPAAASTGSGGMLSIPSPRRPPETRRASAGCGD